MAGENELKELLRKKTLMEIELMIQEHKGKIGKEKNLALLHRLSSELSIMQDVRVEKQRDSGRLIKKNTGTQAKPDLKSYDDYIKSKK